MCAADSTSDVTIVARTAEYGRATKSPFGEDDQVGMLNIVTPDMRRAVLDAADTRDVFDLAVDYFLGMPAFTPLDDPPYQICLTHTPAGMANEAKASNYSVGAVGFTGDVVSMYTHTGTHIDGFNHCAYGDTIWNEYRAADDLASRHWNKGGPEHIPPIITRGILLDFPRALGFEALPDSYGAGPEDVEAALKLAQLEIRPGDAVVFRTGRMHYWPDLEKFSPGYLFPGLNLEGAKAIAEAGAVLVGTDCMAPEQAPSAVPDNPAPVHAYLLATCGVIIAENLWLEDLAATETYEFAFMGSPIKLRGASGAPIRPSAFPLLPGA